MLIPECSANNLTTTCEILCLSTVVIAKKCSRATHHLDRLCTSPTGPLLCLTKNSSALKKNTARGCVDVGVLLLIQEVQFEYMVTILWIRIGEIYCGNSHSKLCLYSCGTILPGICTSTYWTGWSSVLPNNVTLHQNFLAVYCCSSDVDNTEQKAEVKGFY